MVRNLLSFSKRQELLENEYTVFGNKDDLQFHIFCKTIIPSKIIKNRKVFKIIHLDNRYVIKGFVVITIKNKVQKVLLNGFHPNCDYNTYEFCLNENKKDVNLNEEIIEAIVMNINTYYLDNCYFEPRYKHMRYKEVSSIFVNMAKNGRV